MDDKVEKALRELATPTSTANLATIRAHIEALEARVAESDEALTAAYLSGVGNGREAAEARVRELEANDRRYRWLREGSIPKLCIRADRHAGLHNVRMMGSEADAAIDSAMQGEEVRGG